MEEEALDTLLAASRRGEPAAFEHAYALVYQRLRAVAHQERRKLRAGETLSTTALVHEAFLKLRGGAPLPIQDRHHLVALAARAMRHILVDAARARLAVKRGGGAVVEPLADDAALVESALAEEMLALDDALQRLGDADPRLARVAEWRYFGGMTDQELAAALDCNERTVRRDWEKARAFLLDVLGSGAPA